MFSDEVSVEKSKDPNPVWVFRHRNRYEKYLPQNVIPQTKNRGVSLMLWGCFISTIKGPLVTIHGRATAFSYVNLLQVNLIPFMNALSDQGITGAVFQQDNAPIHKAHYTQEWFEQQTFEIMEWPANSPDMNLIEHIWSALKKELFHHFPDIANLPGALATVQCILEEQFQLIWRDIGVDLLKRLVQSMLARVDALIEADGWYTRY